MRPQGNSISRHWVPDPHIKRLPLTNAHTAKDRGTGTMSAPSQGKRVRVGELCVMVGKRNSSDNAWQGPGVPYYNNLLKSPLPPGTSGKTVNGGTNGRLFFIDIRVTYSVVDRPQTEFLQRAVPITGISGSQFFLKPLECAIGDMVLTHKFLYFLKCPISLLEGTSCHESECRSLSLQKNNSSTYTSLQIMHGSALWNHGRNKKLRIEYTPLCSPRVG